ncbi:MAG: hypothetical protein QOH67_2383 [Hyphomicrobiales bacterium]|jgi:tetratricopeptide (TPR) repeat protein|nr:hypothetical protein [Hyphomicrobiales bacterium]
MRAGAFLTGLILGSALLAGPLAAQTDKTWDTCIATDGTPASRLAACTAVIEAKSETGRRLAGAYCIRGHELTERRELDAALTDLDEAVRLDPTYACAFNNRGRAYGLKRGYDRAIADYNEALRLDPNFALAYNNRGIAWRGKGDLDQAIAEFSMAIRVNPTFALAYGKALELKPGLETATASLKRLGVNP